eukprot:gene48102-64551_t
MFPGPLGESLAGRALGLGPLELIDVEARKPGKAAEAELILSAAEGSFLVACDERGRTFSSRAFADWIAELRDGGERRLTFAIGGADDLAARPGAGHAVRTALSRRHHPGRIALSSRLMRRLPILLLLGLAAAAPAGGQTPDPDEVARLSGQYRDAVIRARSLEGQAREAARAAEAAPAPVDGGQTPDRAALDALAARE